MIPRFSRCRLLACALVATLVAAAPAPARDSGDDDRRELRVSERCRGGGTSQLRLRSRDGEIRVDFYLRRSRSGERWRVVLVHERRVAGRATARTSADGSLHVRRRLRDLDGPDRVTARASGPRGLTCEVSGTLPA